MGQQVFGALKYKVRTAAGIERDNQREAIEWKSPDQLIRGSASLSSFVQRESKTLADGDTLAVFITDHGLNGATPLSSGINVARTNRQNFKDPKDYLYSHQALLDDLTKSVPAGASVKLIGIHCFSGGLHEVAQKLPKACSVASSTYDRSTVSPVDGTMNVYGDAFLSETRLHHFDLNGDGKTSLMEGHLAALSKDSLNLGRQNLSSFDYVLKTLKEGPYAAGRVAFDVNLQESESQSHARQFRQMIDAEPPAATAPPATPAPPPLKDLPDLPALPPALQSQFRKIDQFASEHDMKRTDSIPVVAAQTRLQEVRRDLEKKRTVLEAIKQEYNVAKARQATQAELDQITISYRVHQRGADLLNQKVEQLQEQIPLASFAGYQHWLSNVEALNRFYQRATPQEKAKFEALWACEQEAL